METAWKWWLRFMYTVILLLLMVLLALTAITVPRVWGILEKVGDTTDAVERAAEDITDILKEVEKELE